jgi:hypothetical protein
LARSILLDSTFKLNLKIAATPLYRDELCKPTLAPQFKWCVNPAPVRRGNHRIEIFIKYLNRKQVGNLLEGCRWLLLVFISLKVPKCEILMSWILILFYHEVAIGRGLAEIKFLHILQMGEILAILF